jgi:hypothetical protein
LTGDIDVEKLYDAKNTIYDGTISEYEADSAFVKEINTNMHLNLIYADNEQKIASTEAYYDHAKEAIAMRFIFADDSKIAFGTYFDAGFEGFINDLNAFIVELNKNYKLELEPIKY